MMLKINRQSVWSILALLLSLSVVIRLEFFTPGTNRFFATSFLPFIIFISFVMLCVDKTEFKIKYFIFVSFAFSMLIFYNFYWLDASSVFNGIVNVYRSYFYFLFGATLFLLYQNINSKQVELIYFITKFSAACIISIETCVRILYPTFAIKKVGLDIDYISQNASNGLALDNLYLHKIGSFMFSDSNHTGLLALLFLFLCLVFRKDRFFAILFFCLVLLSFSRSAIAGAFIVIFLSFCFPLKKEKLLILTPICFLLIVGLFWNLDIIQLLQKDGSFQTKIGIFLSLSKVSTISISEFLLGFGLTEGAVFYSWRDGDFAHGLIPLLLGQYGAIGFLIYFSVWFWFVTKQFEVFLLLIIMFICGFSLFDPFEISYLWAAITMIKIGKLE